MNEEQKRAGVLALVFLGFYGLVGIVNLIDWILF